MGASPFLLIGAAAALLVSPNAPVAPLQPLYWLEQGNTKAIKRSSLDGSNVQTVISGQGNIWGFTVDNSAGRIYWSTDNAISSSLLDGSNVTTLITGIGSPGALGVDHMGVAIDSVHRAIYFTTFITPDGVGATTNLRRVDLTGQNLVTLDSFQGDGSAGRDHGINAVAVDPAGGHLYWSDNASAGGGLHIANLDGTNDHIVGDYGNGVSFSAAQGKVYVTSSARVERYTANGTGKQTYLNLYDDLFPGNAAIDTLANKIYLADSDNNSIDLFSIPPANAVLPVLSGGASSRLITGLDHPTQVVLIPEPASLALLGSSLLLISRRRQSRGHR